MFGKNIFHKEDAWKDYFLWQHFALWNTVRKFSWDINDCQINTYVETFLQKCLQSLSTVVCNKRLDQKGKIRVRSALIKTPESSWISTVGGKYKQTLEERLGPANFLT